MTLEHINQELQTLKEKKRTTVLSHRLFTKDEMFC